MRFRDLPDADEAAAAVALGWEPRVGDDVWAPVGGSAMAFPQWEAALVTGTGEHYYRVQIWDKTQKAYTRVLLVSRVRVFPRFTEASDL